MVIKIAVIEAKTAKLRWLNHLFIACRLRNRATQLRLIPFFICYQNVIFS